MRLCSIYEDSGGEASLEFRRQAVKDSEVFGLYWAPMDAQAALLLANKLT